MARRGGRNRIGRREKWPKKSWEEGEIGGKSREEGEIGSESREKGDLPPCSPPSPDVFESPYLKGMGARWTRARVRR